MAGPANKPSYRAVYDFDSRGWTMPDPFRKASKSVEPEHVAWEPPQEGKWDPIPNFSIRKDTTGFLQGWLGTMCFIVAALLPLEVPLRHVLWIELGVGSLAVFVYLRLSKQRREHVKHLNYLIEDADDPGVCFVSVQLCRGMASKVGSEIGVCSDEGIAFFEDNALVFLGLQTSFRIGGQDVLPTQAAGKIMLASLSTPLPSQVLSLRPPIRRLSLVFDTLPDSRKCADDARSRFWMSFRDFRVHRKPAEGMRTYPPFARF